MQMLWRDIFRPTNADDTSITYPLLKYVSEILIARNHSLLHHLSYSVSITTISLACAIQKWTRHSKYSKVLWQKWIIWVPRCQKLPDA